MRREYIEGQDFWSKKISKKLALKETCVGDFSQRLGGGLFCRFGLLNNHLAATQNTLPTTKNNLQYRRIVATCYTWASTTKCVQKIHKSTLIILFSEWGTAKADEDSYYILQYFKKVIFNWYTTFQKLEMNTFF